MSTAPAQPSTEDVYAALAQSLLSLAGPAGLLASAAVPAVKQLYDAVTAHPDETFTVDALAAIVAGGNAGLTKLEADGAAAA
jgi:hypothetical protein